jgi:sterol desaturase/sphingolipid hydroxylase (fatty acid hydroxylase superfamily)
MQLSKFGYYSDFIVYPVVFTALAAIGITHATWTSGAERLAACGAGLVAWTLLEYVLHRIALHRMPYFSPMHGLHHAAPLALIGTPSWISMSVLGSVFLLPAWWCFGFNAADGLLVGVMLGYWWYGVVHHVIHHRSNASSPAYFKELRAWHMRHHYSPLGGNFGVTTSVWDRVFGTVIDMRRKAAVPP